MGVISANGFTVFLGWYGSFGLGMFFPAMERTKDRRGLAPGSASTPVACPRTPVTGDASREPVFGRRRGRGGDCFRFPAAAADLAVLGKPSGWTGEARRLPPAVEAGSSTAGGWGHPPLQKAAAFGVGADVSSARCPPPLQVRRIFRQKRNEVSRKVLLPTFLSRKVGQESGESSPNRDHLLAPVMWTSRNWPTACLSPTTRTRRLPGVRAVRG